MIYLSHSEFVEEVKQRLKTALTDPDSYHNNAVFSIGRPDKGFYLFADAYGWLESLNGVCTRRQKHIAAPLSNLQAAYVTIDH